MILMWQCRFILGKKKLKKSTILVSDDNGGGYACLGAATKWEISVFLFQIYGKPKMF